MLLKVFIIYNNLVYMALKDIVETYNKMIAGIQTVQEEYMKEIEELTDKYNKLMAENANAEEAVKKTTQKKIEKISKKIEVKTGKVQTWVEKQKKKVEDWQEAEKKKYEDLAIQIADQRIELVEKNKKDMEQKKAEKKAKK